MIKRYYELVKELGFVDSSLGRHSFDKQGWNRERKLFDALGIDYILSDGKLALPNFKLCEILDGRFLYKNGAALSPLHAVYSWKIIRDPNENLDYLKSDLFDPSREAVIEEGQEVELSSQDLRHDGKVEILSQDDMEIRAETDLSSPAVAVFRSVFYPRWRLELDGRRARLMAADHAFSGFYLEKGRHKIRLYYDQSLHRITESISITGWALLLALNLWARKREKMFFKGRSPSTR